MFNNKIENKGNNNTFIQIQNNVFNFFSVPNIKGFLNHINGRKDEIKLINEIFYILVEFENNKNKYDILNNDRVIIIGNPGSGKTQLLVDIFLEIKSSLNKKIGFYYRNEFLPFFIALRNLGEKETLEQYIQNKKNDFNLKGEQKFIFLLDGLDEINLEETGKIMNFIENNQLHKYIITSRKESINKGLFLSKYQNFFEYEIKEFNFNIEKGGNTKILEEYFLKKGKKIDLEKYKKLQIEIKDVFYLEQFFEVYEKLEEKDGKLELTEKFLREISNKNNELFKFGIELEKLFNLLTKISEFLYKNNSLILEKEKIIEIIKIFSIKKEKDFLDYLLKTFFTKSEGINKNYSFYHKTFYEYFLVRYIFQEYKKNKLSIREGNILMDSEFILKIFFPYSKKQYLKENNYSGIIGLNLFMEYYLNHNPIDEIDSEIFINSLFNLPEGLLRYYIYKKDSPIYNWFNSFHYLNFNTIKIVLDKGNIYKDIADCFYKKLNNLIEEKNIRKKVIIKELRLLNKDNKDSNIKRHDLEQENRDLFNGLNFYNQAYCKVYFLEFKNYFEIYIKLNEKFELRILDRLDFSSKFYKSPYYSFFDDLLKYSEEKEILQILKELEKDEFYAFLQVGLKLENIKNILGNKNILDLIKEKFNFYKGDFKEFINYNKNQLKIKDSAITLFLKYIFKLYNYEKEIFDSKDFYELKEGSNGFFDRHWGFYKSNLDNNQLASYLFYHQVNMKKNIEDEYVFSKNETIEKNSYRYHGYYKKRCIYQYSYSIFLDSIINKKSINFKEYIDIISEYITLRSDDSVNIKIIYSEILAYIFYYNVNGDYLDNVNLIWDNLEEFVDKINFYKTIKQIDELNKTDKLNEINNIDKINLLNKDIVKVFDYPASEVEDYIFISQLYGLNLNKDLQVKYFDKGIANSYVKYGYSKDYYLTLVFYILEELKEKGIINETQTFDFLDKIIKLYGIIDGITEKGVAYLGKDLINFIAKFSIKKAEEYSQKIDDITNSSFYDINKSIILSAKIKNNNYKNEDIEYLHFYDDDSNILEVKIYLHLINNGEDKFIEYFNETIKHIKILNIWYYWYKEDLELYKKLYENGKVEKSDLLFKELERLNKKEKEIISLEGLSNDEIINLLNDKYIYGMSHSSGGGYYDYLLNELYLKDKELFNKYISGENFNFHKEKKYDFFSNFQGLIKVYIENNEKEKAIELFDELLNFAKLLIK